MSISPLSSVLSTYSSAQSSQGSASTRRQDFAELANALQSGDLTQAQQAYSALQQTGGPPSNGTSGNSPVAADFTALGKALASGNLSQAQDAFSQLQNDVKSAQTSASQSPTAHNIHGHHHHYGSGDADQTSATTPSTTTNNASGGTINLLG